MVGKGTVEDSHLMEARKGRKEWRKRRGRMSEYVCTPGARAEFKAHPH